MKLEAKDLRCGNLFIYDHLQTESKQGWITGVLKDSAYLSYQYPCFYNHGATTEINEVPVSFNKLIPIPLTEEWLLKFGFETNGVTFKNGWIEIWFSSYVNGYIIRLYTIGSDSEKPITVKHVHQLQNIYFALTGTDLEIK